MLSIFLVQFFADEKLHRLFHVFHCGDIEGLPRSAHDPLLELGHQRANTDLRVLAFLEVLFNGGGGVALQDGPPFLQGVAAEIEPEALFFIGELLCFTPLVDVRIGVVALSFLLGGCGEEAKGHLPALLVLARLLSALQGGRDGLHQLSSFLFEAVEGPALD